MENLKISKGTIGRTIVLIVALLNQVCAMLGWAPLDLDESTIYEVCTLVATVGSSLWAFWKNNSFTQAALIGDKAKDEAKLMKRLDLNYTDDRRDDVDVEEVEIEVADHEDQ